MAEWLADDARGSLRMEGNELIADSKIADAAAMRVGSPKAEGQSSGGGKYSFDDTTNPSSRREIGLMSVGDGVFGPEFKLQLLKKDGGSTDADMANPMRATATEVEFTVPIRAPNLTGGGVTPPPPQAPTFLKNGQYELHLQGDGNLVLYNTGVEPWEAMWNSGTARGE